MTRDKGITYPYVNGCRRISLLKYDADAVAMGLDQIAGGITVASA